MNILDQLTPSHTPEIRRQLEGLSQAVIQGLAREAKPLDILRYFMLGQGIELKFKSVWTYMPSITTKEEGDDHVRESLRIILNDVLKSAGFKTMEITARGYMILTDTAIVGYVTNARTENIKIVFKVGGPEPLRQWLEDEIKNRFPTQMPSSVNRLWINRNRLGDPLDYSLTSLPLRKEVENIEAFYPYFDKSPAEVWEGFAASSSNVLLLIGPPGTGKSTFIYELLNARGWDKVTYLADREDVLLHAELSDFIHERADGELMVTEDSDKLVAKREDGNSRMSPLLNATSGIANNAVKLIISTNLNSLNRVDEALIRPGRTFSVLHFKPLTLEQAYKARQAAGLPEIKLGSVSGTLTLAEALNYEITLDTRDEISARRVGF